MGLASFRSQLECVLDGPVERNNDEIRLNLKFKFQIAQETRARTYRVVAPPIFFFNGISKFCTLF